MADYSKIITLQNLSDYDVLLKRMMADADAAIDAKSLKCGAVVADTVYFFKTDAVPQTAEGAVDTTKAAFHFDISSSDVEQLKVDVAANKKAIEDEAARADAAEKANAKAIEDEAKRADEAEKANAQAIADEKTRAEGAESDLSDAIGAEKTRAEKAESDLSDAIGAEAERADTAEKANKKAIEDEIIRATAAEGDLDKAVKAAQKAADDAQADVNSLDELVGFTAGTGEEDPKTVIAYVDKKVAEASSDASKVAEDLAAEITRATTAEGANATAISDEVTRATGAEEALGDRIDDVEDLIGEVEEGKTVMGIIAANQTADRKYTDDAISALGSVLNFKGIVETEADLPTEGMKQGDVYNVKTTARGTSAEFVYITDKGWEELGDVLDLSAYDTRTVTEGKIATAKSEAITAAEGYADGLDDAMDIRMKAVEAAIGEGGSVQDKIDASIALLDSAASLGEGEDYLTGLTITDGKITAHTAGTFHFDEDGAAAAVQGDTESTVADVEADLETYKWQAASNSDITKLFSTDEQE